MIITRSPLRISLGGGGTDLPSYYEEHGGFLVAAAIDKYVYITLHETFVPELIVKYSKLERVTRASELEHPIIREAFAMMGAEVAESVSRSPLIVVLMGTMTGVAGGVLRDVLTAQVPLILRRDIYATAAIAGVAVYLLLQASGLQRSWAFAAGMIVVVVLRLVAIRWRVHLPGFGTPER